MPRLSRPVLGWLLYDVASSGYALLIPALAYAVYYRQVVCGGGAECDAQWAMLTSVSLVVAGLAAPFLGALSDQGQIRYQLFLMATLLCCGATAALFWVQPGAIVFGSIAFFLAQTGYIMAMSLYDAYLPTLVPKRQLGQLSGWGWGLGYLGGLTCLFVSYRWMQGGLEETNLAAYRLTFLVVAGFYALMALPAMTWLPRQSRRSRFTLDMVGQAYNQVFDTLRNWRQTPDLFQFLLGYYLISDGVATVVSFTAIYLRVQFGLGIGQILQLTLLFNAIAIPATIGFGLLNQRWQARALLKIILAIWVITLLVLTLGNQPFIPVLGIVGLGLVVGSTQSICRGLYAQMVTPGEAAEKFGFHALVSKVSAIGGPLVFGFLSAATGNQRVAMLSVIGFILAGAWVLFQVPVLAAQPRQARTGDQ
jgi:UMF1 family MFS transporter